MSSVKLVNITKSFDEKIVLEDINIDIKDGIVMLCSVLIFTMFGSFVA